jgi:beta-phosphoglucomutase-like phosphatase (HAD superfamily)
MPLEALIFDCDGVLVDTERDGHRVAFNAAFAAAELATEWDVARYGALLTTGGGKERTIRHFDETGWPVPEAERAALIARLHRDKTDRFMRIIEGGTLPLRPGVARLIGSAQDAGLPVAVCSTANERAVGAVVQVLLGGAIGAARAGRIRIFAGDAVARKKPDPAIYTLAATTLALAPAHCVVIEDSRIGLAAARAAGMPCIVTKSTYTADEDFTGASLVVEDLDSGGIDLAACAALAAT